jgi:hypothetical protein
VELDSKQVKLCYPDQPRYVIRFRCAIFLIHLQYPWSEQRVLSVSGVADAIHIAVYYIGTILQEHPIAQAAHTSYRPSGANQSYSGGGGGDYQSRNSGGQRPQSSSYAGGAATAAGSQTQQIFIPNELVGVFPFFILLFARLK